MSTLPEVQREALALTEADRLALARELLESCEVQPAKEAQQAWESELGRRLEEVEAGVADGRPSVDVFREIDQKFGWDT